VGETWILSIAVNRIVAVRIADPRKTVALKTAVAVPEGYLRCARAAIVWSPTAGNTNAVRTAA
jgi:hypothetical protein